MIEKITKIDANDTHIKEMLYRGFQRRATDRLKPIRPYFGLFTRKESFEKTSDLVEKVNSQEASLYIYTEDEKISYIQQFKESRS